MNKTAIKNYAIWARVNLIEAAKQRAYQYEITKDNITDAVADVVSGKPLTNEEKEQRMQLIDQINRKGFDQVMEEVAYTWFNRFIALRFMEVNGYLPTKIRVFTDAEGNFKPEILKEALTVELPVDKSRVMELLEKQDNEELYKMLLIAQCNELSNGLPDMFEVISNYTELLFPNNLLKEDSILGEMVNSIPEEDWTDAVQIIGWLYQYYNSELKDETFALLKKNVKISKERIPAATQLFTPDWIVRYMVENSLGRLWYEGHPNVEFKKDWKYYLDEAQQEPEVEEQLKAIREEYKSINPEDIKVIDPCMGSGHILVYAFDVLMQIYTSAGWSERDAAESILEKNLYGLDIDDRAGQLAYFAVMMKARKYNRKILTKNIRPKVYSIQESNNVKIEAWWRLGPEENIARRLVQDLTDAKEYGSILNLSVTAEELLALRKRLDDIEEMSDQGNLLDVIQSDEITRQLYPLVELAEIMVQKYDVVVTNPPYMSSSNASQRLKKYINDYFPEGKADLYSSFILNCFRMCSPMGIVSMITMQSWMFLASFESLRYRLNAKCLYSLAQIGYNSFPELNSKVAQATMFCFRNSFVGGYKSVFLDLSSAYSQNYDKEQAFFVEKEKGYCIRRIKQFENIAGSPYVYWMSDNMLGLFDGLKIGEFAEARIGLATGCNDYYLRMWHEVSFDCIGFMMNRFDAKESRLKWFPYNKGGEYRKWYGNQDYIVNWENDGEELQTKLAPDGERIWAHNFNLDYIFKPQIAWSYITTSSLAFRFYDKGFIFDSAGTAAFVSEDIEPYIIAYLNSCVTNVIAGYLDPTMHFTPGEFSIMPYKPTTDYRIKDMSRDCVSKCKQDWDSYETSWCFKKNPLI